MSVYSVYEPPGDADLASRAERLAFVKEGFSWPAFFVPLLWLIYYRMWVEFVLLVLVYVALQLAFGTDSQGQSLVGWIGLGISVLFALEANDLRTSSLERRGYALAGVASGRSRTEAERAFFTAWLPRQAKAARDAERRPEPRREVEGAAPTRPGAESEEVIGLFPRP